jgi:hypothetical protein
MRNRCKDTEDVIIESYVNANVERDYEDPNISELKKDEKIGGWFKRLSDKFKYKGEVTEEEVKTFADKYFGINTESTKIQMISKISSALGRRKDLRDVFYHKLSDLVSKNRANLPEVEGGYVLSKMDDGTFIYNMYKLPYSMVHQAAVILNEDLMSLEIDSDLNIKKGWLGNLVYEFMLPRNVAYKTTSPSLVRFIKSITYFNQRREAREKEFMSASPNAILGEYEFEAIRDKNGELKKDSKGNILRTRIPKKYNRKLFGLSELYNSELAETFNKYGKKYFKSDIQLMNFIHLYMMNLISIEADGKVFLRTKYGKRFEGDKIVRYSDGNPQYKFHEKEPLIIKDGQIVNWDQTHRDIVKKDGKNVSGDSVSQLQFSTELNKLTKKDDFDMIYELIDGIQNSLWNFGHAVKIKGEEQSAVYNSLLLEAQDVLSDKDLSEFKIMAEQMFEGELFGIHGLTQLELQEKNKHYFPKKVTIDNRVYYMSKAESDLERVIADTQLILNDPNTDKKRIPAIKDQQYDNVRSLAVIQEKLQILNNGNTQFDETNSNNPIFLHNYVKNFKSVTNMIPFEGYRLDENVARDYISETSMQIERRGLANDLLKLFIESHDKPKVKKYAINMFKRLFGYPDARGMIMGIPTTDDGLESFLKKWSGGLYSGKKHNANRLLKDFSAIHTSALLSGVGDGLVNYFSTMQDMINSGKNEFLDAFSEYSANKTKWTNLAEKAGIITFSKYLEGYVDDILRSEDIKSARNLKKDLIKIINKIENTHKGKVPSSQKKFWLRYKRDVDLLNKQIPTRFHVLTSQLARYAINHRIESAKYEKGWTKRIKQMSGVYDWVPSIQKTELALRTMSFIIGWKNAEKLTRDFPNITEKDKIQLAREYVYFTQFGLESHLVGEATGSSLSKFFNGITNFRKQKVGYDRQVNQEWIRTYYNPTSLIDSLDKNIKTDKKKLYQAKLTAEASVKALMNLINWKGGWAKRKQLLRQAVPSAAQGDSFFMIHGLASSFFHFGVFGNPINAGIMATVKRFVLKNNMVQAGTGFTSPFYMGILASSSLIYAMGKSILDDDEEEGIRFYDFYRFFRGLYGTGYMDSFAIMYSVAQSTRDYFTGDVPVKRDYYSDPMRHVTIKPDYKSPYSVARKGVEGGLESLKDWYNKTESNKHRFGNY